MAGFLSNLFGRKSESVLGIDIGSSSIKVVQLSRKGSKAVLETYGELSLGPYAGVEIGRATNLGPDKIIEALKDVLRESSTTTKNAGLAIPFSASLMTVMEMPMLPQKQLAPMIPIEARKYIPVPISEVTLDWWIIPKADNPNLETEEEIPEAKKGEKLDILVVAIHNDVINRYQQIIQAVNLDAGFLEIEIFSTIRSAVEQDVAPVMVFDMGAASTKLYIIERGVIRNTHTVNRGSQDITLALAQSLATTVANAEVLKRNYKAGTTEGDAGKIGEIVTLTLDYIFSEANRVIFNYQHRYNKNISKVILVGGGVKVGGFFEAAKKGLQTEVVLGDPFGKTEVPAFLENMLRTTGPEFAVALGIALRRLSEIE